MSNNINRNISITGDIQLTGIQEGKASDYAAGVQGVKVTLEHTFKEMGILNALKGLAYMNQKEGFDCAGCAWPDPEKPSKIAEYCENGAKALAEEATHLTLGPEFFAKHSVEELSQWSDFKIGKSGRLISPMVLRPHKIHYEPISWKDAFTLIADELKNLNNPDEAIFYTSGRSSNEAAFLYGLFVRAFGTNNMPDCSNMCHESSGVALTETLGIGKGSVKLEDFYEAEVVMVIGQNPGTNHPRMLTALQKCKKNGGKVISINPLEEIGLKKFKNPQEIKGVTVGQLITDIYLQVKINQDVALLKLLMKKLAKLDAKNASVFDHNFILKHTAGYKSLLNDLDTYSEEELLDLCGVPEAQVNKAVNLLAQKSKIIICWAMGLTQHKNGVENIKECVNLLLLKGSLGKPGAGTCPVRGHSNVQGDRTVGIMHYVSDELNAAIEKVFGFKPPTEEGVDTVHALEAMHKGKASVFMALGGNFVSAVADTSYAAAAMKNCSLTVQISTKLNRGHLITGKTGLILPTLGRSEKDASNGKDRFLTVENSMGKVHRTKGILTPKSDNLKSEPEIIGGIANAFFQGKHPVDWNELGGNYEMIREKLAETIQGFNQVQSKSEGSGFYLPNNVRNLDFSKLPNGKAQFSICKPAKHDLKPNELLLMSIRSHDQFNTTIYGLNDRYRGIYNERRVVFMNPEDMVSHQLSNKEEVDLVSNYDDIERRAAKFLVIPYNIPKGNLAAYFPETNMIIPHNHFADKSNTPISKSVAVSIEKR
ncbi:MAG: FdhF/YdeP family oxidoreductase [Maribacter sp.]